MTILIASDPLHTTCSKSIQSKRYQDLAVLELIFAFLRKRLQIVRKILKGVSWVPHVSPDDLTALMICTQES